MSLKRFGPTPDEVAALKQLVKFAKEHNAMGLHGSLWSSIARVEMLIQQIEDPRFQEESPSA